MAGANGLWPEPMGYGRSQWVMAGANGLWPEPIRFGGLGPRVGVSRTVLRKADRKSPECRNGRPGPWRFGVVSGVLCHRAAVDLPTTAAF
jgi:hypothetical protein